jgi:uncharacterized protein YabE (DUF348 family)
LWYNETAEYWILRFVKKYTFLIFVALSLALVFVWPVSAFWDRESRWEAQPKQSWLKRITLHDDGLTFDVYTSASTVKDFVDEKSISLNDRDEVSPSLDTSLYAGTVVYIRRAREISVETEQDTRRFWTLQKTVEDALLEQSIVLDENDFTFPGRESTVYDGMKVTVVHVVVKEEVIEKPIAFEKKVKEDEKMSWRKQEVLQKGEKGVQQFTYKVLSHNGKEVKRELLKKEVTKEPVEEIVVQGTHVEVGKSHTGLGTWYAFTGTLAAASPWLPMGSYVRVTNQDNGKQVIVKINDRGPFGPNRIIDLDKVAFAKIASIGAGVINVKVEEIKN